MKTSQALKIYQKYLNDITRKKKTLHIHTTKYLQFVLNIKKKILTQHTQKILTMQSSPPKKNR